MISNIRLKLPQKETQGQGWRREDPFDMQVDVETLPILLVEDYEPHVMVAGIILKNFGYDFESVKNGEQAMERFAPGKYAMILMDVGMPRMDGYETTQHIREQEQTAKFPPVPIIAMTAHAMKGDREKCLDAGMDDYISKPFNLHQFQSTLTRHMKKW